MAFTKVVGSGIKDDTKVTVGVLTASSGVKGVGIFSGGTAVHSGITVSYTHLRAHET